jgi:YggT family protein
VINTRNAFVYQIADFLNRATEPALRPIRNILPNLGGIDISPVVLILLLVFIRRLIWQLFS